MHHRASKHVKLTHITINTKKTDISQDNAVRIKYVF